MANLSKIKFIERDWQSTSYQAVSVGIYDNLQLNRQLQGVNRKLGRSISHVLSTEIIKGKSIEDLNISNNDSNSFLISDEKTSYYFEYLNKNMLQVRFKDNMEVTNLIKFYKK